MDSILIFPPGPSVAGSQLQLGTYLMWDPGADYGAKGLINSIESSNALRDGGVFAYRSVPPRKMAFPLLLRDVPGQTLLQTESLLREWTTAGAAVAVQPETVPSGQAVFFDVLDGRWEPEYDGFHNRAGRRKGTLYLDTQPWGYWPTEMLLASAASIGNLGQLAVNGASLLGDVPPLAHIAVAPTVASQYVASNYFPDMIALSLGARPSFTPFISPSSFIGGTLFGTASFYMAATTVSADKFAPASVAMIFSGTPYVGGNTPSLWGMIAHSASFISSALEPAYRGRFRVFGFFQASSGSLTITNTNVLVDAERVLGVGSVFTPMASANQVATVYSKASNGAFAAINPRPGYDMVDLGELSLPPAASGVQQNVRLRVWANPYAASPAAGQTLSFGGLYLLPVDGAAGIVPRGMALYSYPLTGVGGIGASAGAVEFNANSVEGQSFTSGFPVAVGAPAPVWQDARAQYHGAPLRLGASTQRLLLITGDRSGNQGLATFPLVDANLEYAQVSVSYRPTFQFLAGL